MMLVLLLKFDQQFVWIATCCFQTYWCLICKLNKHCVCATCCGWFSKHFQRCIFLFKSVSCFWVQCSIRFLITKITHMYCCFLFIVTVVWETSLSREKKTKVPSPTIYCPFCYHQWRQALNWQLSLPVLFLYCMPSTKWFSITSAHFLLVREWWRKCIWFNHDLT